MTNDSDSLIDFPCEFPIKAMGRNADDFEAVVTEIVQRHAQFDADSAVALKPSAEGNFLSVTVTIEARSKDQLDRIYQDLTDCEQILMAL